MNPIYRSQPSYDNMEFPRHDLEALRSLGNGAYGRAFLARASGIRDGERETMVVVKALVSNDDQVREEFNKDIDALCNLHHENVVALLGVCKEEEPFYMIFESLEKVCFMISLWPRVNTNFLFISNPLVSVFPLEKSSEIFRL